MGAEKKNLRQKPQSSKNVRAGSSSENVKLKLTVKRKVTSSAIPTIDVAEGDSKRTYIGCSNEDNCKTSNISILNYLNHLSNGNSLNPPFRRFQKICIVNNIIKNFTFTTLSPFERRVTSIAWHPKYSHIVSVGSKGGELELYNIADPAVTHLPGIGAGGSIVGLKFNLDNPDVVYTASITGDIREENFLRRVGKTLITTGNIKDWFSSLDISYEKKTLLFGDNIGNVYLMKDTGEKVWSERQRLHAGKVSHVEFSKKEPNLFVTASIDHSVKLWDFRMMSENNKKNNPLLNFPHHKGVNSAYFSPSNGVSLLTTDQHSEVRVYKSPNWEEKLVIPHPHRQFQHLTPIKASWHPLDDVIIVGRYPDKNFLIDDERTIDFYDGSTGELLYGMKSPNGGIITLNSFNNTGDCLVSGSGSNIIFMKDKEIFDGVAFRKAIAQHISTEDI